MKLFMGREENITFGCVSVVTDSPIEYLCDRSCKLIVGLYIHISANVSFNGLRISREKIRTFLNRPIWYMKGTAVKQV